MFQPLCVGRNPGFNLGASLTSVQRDRAWQGLEHQAVASTTFVQAKGQKYRLIEQAGDGQWSGGKRGILPEKWHIDDRLVVMAAVGQHGHHPTGLQRLGDLQHDARTGLTSIDNGLGIPRVQGFHHSGEHGILLAIHHNLELLMLRDTSFECPQCFETAQVGTHEQASPTATQDSIELFDPFGLDVQFPFTAAEQQYPVDDSHGKCIDVQHYSDGSRPSRPDPFEPGT